MKSEYIKYYNAAAELLDLTANDKKVLATEEVDYLFRSALPVILKLSGFVGSAEELDTMLKEIRHQIDIDRAQTYSGGGILEDKQYDHEKWLESSANNIEWTHWHEYKKYMIQSGHNNQIKSLNEQTNRILDSIENPMRPGPWDVRGLVVGDVQAGKTSNYIGLMSKAVDAGYKILIVLAGTTNDLRKQTQERIDAGLLGYDTKKKFEHGTVKPAFKGNVISSLTDSNNNGDYTKGKFSTNVRIGNDCILYVIKKNVSILRNVFWDLKNNSGYDNKIDVPVLLIDDEADNASINGKQQPYDPITKKPISSKETDPAKTNLYIRAILSCFNRSAYIGYTATPYANIFGVPNLQEDKKFMNKEGLTIDVGEDLFPRNFICYLPSPNNYYGPEQIFGLSGSSDRLPIVVDTTKEFNDDFEVVYNDDGEYKRDAAGRIKYQLKSFPTSLEYAIDGFLISSAVKYMRHNKQKHNTLLIHIDRYTASHEIVKTWVDTYLQKIKDIFLTQRRNKKDEYYEKLKSIWESDFVVTHDKLEKVVNDNDMAMFEWDEIWTVIPKYVKEVSCAIVNGTKAASVLKYEDYKEGYTVIAIGGDKLARGLTLEGLSTSYFLRSSRMYDSLTQMGRWFGYRDGYIDLCRIYASTAILDDFEEIAIANSDLKQQFDDLTRQTNRTPKDFGFRIRTAPDTSLLVTARNKSRNIKKTKISFSGHMVSSAYLPSDRSQNESNLELITSFVDSLGPVSSKRALRYEDRDKGTSYCWENINIHKVIEDFFTDNLYVDSQNVNFNRSHFVEYIQALNSKHKEISNWTVALIGGSSDKKYRINDEVEVNLAIRKVKDKSGYIEVNQRRLLTGEDEAFDLSKEEYDNALKETNELRKAKNEPPTTTPSPISIRNNRNRNNALLLIYMIDAYEDGDTVFDYVIPGFGVSLPQTEHKDIQVEYWLNSVAIKNALEAEFED